VAIEVVLFCVRIRFVVLYFVLYCFLQDKFLIAFHKVAFYERGRKTQLGLLCWPPSRSKHLLLSQRSRQFEMKNTLHKQVSLEKLQRNGMPRAAQIHNY
jgi:hypothetical protein